MKNFLSSIANFFSRPKTEEIFLGVRGEGSGIDNVYEFNEVVGISAPPEFKEKKESEWRTFFQQYQYTCSGCVAFTMAKIVAILYFIKTGRKVKFSPGFYYPRRNNKPQEGMFYEDIVQLASEGAIPADFLPSEGLTEAQMNALKIEQYHLDCAKGLAIPKDWVNLPIDFDTVAATLEKTKKGIMAWFTIRSGEFFRRRVVGLVPASANVSGHSVTLVDAFKFLGFEYILAEDSAEQGDYLKLIPRDYFQARCYLARYPINFKYERGDKPVYDGSIISAQKCLVYEGFFPSNVPFAENVGKVTSEALRKFQTKHGLSVTGTLSGDTVAQLQKLYA